MDNSGWDRNTQKKHCVPVNKIGELSLNFWTLSMSNVANYEFVLIEKIGPNEKNL